MINRFLLTVFLVLVTVLSFNGCMMIYMIKGDDSNASNGSMMKCGAMMKMMMPSKDKKEKDKELGSIEKFYFHKSTILG